MPDGGRLAGSVPARPADRKHRTLRHNSPQELVRINEPGIDLVLWRRSLPVELAFWLELMPADHLPQGRVLAHQAALPDALDEVCKASAAPEGSGVRHLREDVMDLAVWFARIAGSEIVDVSLDAVEDNACWKFHPRAKGGSV